jgi:hypothetical protein
VLFGLVEEIGVLDLELMTFFVEVKLGLFHGFLMFLLQHLNFLGMFGMEGLNLVSDGVVPLDLEIDFILVVFF